jgi:hypothetical protein
MKTKLRHMEPEDVPAVLELLKAQNERDGTSYPLPQVFDDRGVRLSRIPLALVAVDVKTGEVKQAHIWETTLEHMAFGVAATVTAASAREQAAVWHLLRMRGFQDEHMLVPAERAAYLERWLEKVLGMIYTGHEHFYRRLDPAENTDLRKFYQDQRSERSPADE